MGLCVFGLANLRPEGLPCTMQPEEYIGKTPHQPYFDLDTPLPATPNLDFEPYTWNNYLELYKLFRWDLSKFVAADFKNKKRIFEYANYQLNHARYSPKRGACDWYFKTKDGAYAGIIHLYDLSLENLAESHKRCTIGFATSRKFRKKGLTREAVSALLCHCFGHFGMDTVISYTRRENKKAISFLEKNGFLNNDAAYLSEKYRYFEMPRQHFFSMSK